MEIRQLRYLTAVVQERSFTRAAARLHMTQPPLSASIAQLERELGVSLLERHGRGVEPTEAGEHLVARAGTILADLEDAEASVRSVGTGTQGSLSIAASPGCAWELLPSLLQRFDALTPDVTTEVVDAVEPDVVDLVRGRTCDVGLVYCSRASHLERLHARDLEVAMIRREPLVAVVPAAHALAGADDVALGRLASERWLAPVVHDGFPGVAQQAREVWEREGVEPPVRRRLTSMETTVRLVEGGSGFALVPSSVASAVGGASSPVRVVRLSEPTAPVEAVVLWRRGERRSPVLTRFLRAALSTLEPDRLGPDHERRGHDDE
ncbi:MAG: LysR family transcriptional regulator [Nocardioidaceae bacterium]|nr:LysR family transcriptional regulator [Nocardioidaceae bacterium]